MTGCKSTTSRDDDEPALHCELPAGHAALHRRGNVHWFETVEVKQ